MVVARRSVLVRGSFLLNVVFALYVALHVAPPPGMAGFRGPVLPHDNLTTSGDSDYPSEGDSPTLVHQLETSPDPWEPATPAPTLQEKVYPDLHTCHTPALTPQPLLRGNHWILYNYAPADTQPACNESVTYTTHADFTFLDNIVPLVERWRGPISIAVFSPGADFNITVMTVAFLRACRPLVAKHVTFHLFFPSDHMPVHVPPTSHVLATKPSCSQHPPYSTTYTYKRAHNLTYPVNVARNVARTAAATYFILASDVELYPSQNFIPKFLEMMRKQDVSRSPVPARRVYVLPIFEVKSGLRPPGTKTALLRMLKRGSAVPFHKFVCPLCHLIPGIRDWASDGGNSSSDSLSVVTVAKRYPPYNRWEPIYVGTHLEPLYEERLSWEGRSDKMTQVSICFLF